MRTRRTYVKSKPKPELGKCKYCQNQVTWFDKKPYDSYVDRKRHHCDKYPIVRKVEKEIINAEYKRDIELLKEEIEGLRKEMRLNRAPSQTASFDHEKRIKRLESVVVELRSVTSPYLERRKNE